MATQAVIPPPPPGYTATTPPPPPGYVLEGAAPTTAPSEAIQSAKVVAGAIPKAVTGFADMFGNAPVNAYNLLRGAGHYARELAGSPNWDKNTVIEQPNFAHRALTAAGIIRPENEPTNTRDRILDAATQGAVSMLANPVKGAFDVGRNVISGLVAGTAGEATKELTGNKAAGVAASIVSPFVTARLGASSANSIQNSVGQKTLEDAHKLGFAVPPHAIKPSFATNRLESIAGRAAIEQQAVHDNQFVADSVARRELGMAEHTPLTVENLEKVREAPNKVYEQVNALKSTPAMPYSPYYHSTDLLEQLKQTRAETTGLYKRYDYGIGGMRGDPATLEEARASKAKSDAIEQHLEARAKASGVPGLWQAFKDARTTLAKTHDVEHTLNVGDGHVSLPDFGKMVDRGHPLTGNLAVMGKFAQAYKKEAREASSTPYPSVSGTEAIASALLATNGAAALGWKGAALAAVPLLRHPLRNALLSDTMQNRLLREQPTFSESLRKAALLGASQSK